MANEVTEPNDHTRAFLQMEYGILRGELIKRVEFRQRLLEITLVSAAAILAINLSGTAFGRVLLGYPILVMFLAAGWLHQDLRVRRLATYVRTRIEPEFRRLDRGEVSDVGYETWATMNDDGRDAYIGNAASIFMFITIQVSFFILGSVSLLDADDRRLTDILLLIISSIATLATAILLPFYRQWPIPNPFRQRQKPPDDKIEPK